MKKDVREVRKNILKRKKEKGWKQAKTSSEQQLPFPQMEEQHGYMPVSPEVEPSQQWKDTFVQSLVMKSILAGILFFGTAILYRVDLAWVEQPRQWTEQAMTEEFPFATVNKWYQEKLGYPLAMMPVEQNMEPAVTDVLPVSGTVTQPFQVNGEAIKIAADEKTEVISVKDGTVLFAGKESETGKTVIVQHADKSKSIYGQLTAIHVHPYQFIKANDVIGEFDPLKSTAKDVYFAIQKGNQFLDPVKVMQVDDRQ